MNSPSSPASRTVRSFASLWAARDLAAVGDGILLVALLAWCYRVLESATALSILLVALLFPPFLLRPVATRVVNRRWAQPAAAAAQLLRAAALLPLLNVSSGSDLPQLLVVAFAAAIPSPFVEASRERLLRSLVRGARRVAAEKALANTRPLTLAVGPAAGTALFGAVGLHGATTATLAALLISTLLLFLVSPSSAASDAEESLDETPGPADLQAGLVLLWHHLPLRSVALVQLGGALMAGGLVVAQTAFTVWGILLTSENVGLILAAQGTGTVVASLGRTQIERRFPPHTLIASGLGILASASFGLAIAGSITAAVSFGAAVGFGLGLLATSAASLVEILCPPRVRPSAVAGLGMATEAAVLLSAIALGPLSDLMTPRLAIVLVSVILAVLALYSFGSVPDRDALLDRV